MPGNFLWWGEAAAEPSSFRRNNAAAAALLREKVWARQKPRPTGEKINGSVGAASSDLLLQGTGAAGEPIDVNYVESVGAVARRQFVEARQPLPRLFVRVPRKNNTST